MSQLSASGLAVDLSCVCVLKVPTCPVLFFLYILSILPNDRLHHNHLKCVCMCATIQSYLTVLGCYLGWALIDWDLGCYATKSHIKRLNTLWPFDLTHTYSISQPFKNQNPADPDQQSIYTGPKHLKNLRNHWFVSVELWSCNVSPVKMLSDLWEISEISQLCVSVCV